MKANSKSVGNTVDAGLAVVLAVVVLVGVGLLVFSLVALLGKAGIVLVVLEVSSIVVFFPLFLLLSSSAAAMQEEGEQLSSTVAKVLLPLLLFATYSSPSSC